MGTSISAAAVLLVASREVGVHEQGGNNRGPRVEQYQDAVGIRHAVPPPPWCAAFVAWCMYQAGVKAWERTGYCPDLYSWAEAHKCLSGVPQVGDVFLLMDAKGRMGAYHTGLVEAVAGSNVRTIEGNTGLLSDADGDGVARKSRPISACRFIHWQTVIGAPAKPALRVTLASSGKGDLGRVVECHPAIEDSVTRVDLRPLCDALGAELELHLDDGVIVVHPKP